MSINVTSLPARRSAAQIITEAVNAAHYAGIPIHTDPHMGVVCISGQHPRWQRNPRSEAVGPLGCVLLAEQPDVSMPDEALCHVFGSKMLFHLGIEDGVMGAKPSENLQRGPDAQLYRDGFRVGVQVRLLLCTECCTGHNVRYPRGERCSQCAAGVPVPRLRADEITLPIVVPPEV